MEISCEKDIVCQHIIKQLSPTLLLRLTLEVSDFTSLLGAYINYNGPKLTVADLATSTTDQDKQLSSALQARSLTKHVGLILDECT